MLDARRVRLGRELFLAGLGIPLDAVDSWALDRMIWLLDEQPVHAGEHLFSVGEPPEFLYFMRDGKVKMAREGAAPWVFEGRWLIGGFEALTDRPRDRDAVALVDFSAMRVPTAAWIDLLEDSFAMARGAVMNTARAVAKLEERVPVDAPRVPQDPPHVGSGPLSLVERLALLVNVRILSGGGVQALADLATASAEASFAAGATILERGVARTHVHLVVHGEVRANRGGPEVTRVYGAGDVVCGVSAFGAPSLPWEARAMTPTRVLSFPIRAVVRPHGGALRHGAVRADGCGRAPGPAAGAPGGAGGRGRAEVARADSEHPDHPELPSPSSGGRQHRRPQEQVAAANLADGVAAPEAEVEQRGQHVARQRTHPPSRPSRPTPSARRRRGAAGPS